MAEVGKREPSIRRELVCFHAQQAAEKAIKGVLLSWKIDFPLTHDLEQLLELAERSGIPLPEAVQAAGGLTPYAVETRYPGFSAEITDADVAEAIRTAAAVIDWAGGLIAQRGESG